MSPICARVPQCSVGDAMRPARLVAIGNTGVSREPRTVVCNVEFINAVFALTDRADGSYSRAPGWETVLVRSPSSFNSAGPIASLLRILEQELDAPGSARPG